MTEVLTVAARDIRPGDAVTEGTIVVAITIGEEEAFDLVTGPSRAWFVTLDLAPARIVVAEIHDGQHLHRLATGTDMRRYPADELVRIDRPAPLQPCECGFS